DRAGSAACAGCPRREGLRVLAEVTGEPGVEIPAVNPRLPDSFTCLRGRDPRFDRPAAPVDEALVLEQLAARVVLSVGRWNTLQLLPFDALPLGSQRGDDRGDLLAGSFGRDGRAIRGKLGGLHH